MNRATNGNVFSLPRHVLHLIRSEEKSYVLHARIDVSTLTLFNLETCSSTFYHPPQFIYSPLCVSCHFTQIVFSTINDTLIHKPLTRVYTEQGAFCSFIHTLLQIICTIVCFSWGCLCAASQFIHSLGHLRSYKSSLDNFPFTFHSLTCSFIEMRSSSSSSPSLLESSHCALLEWVTNLWELK